ncbi:MAG: DUF805 domain-containing protein [Thermomicrobiales bacterium]|nr:DUF805 domain-containing protein [Thermomicrobiales bacterium]
MNFVEAVRSGFNNYANFSGRALRSEYWWWVVFAWIAGMVANLIDSAFGWRVYETTINGIQQGSGPIAALVGLALLIPGLAVAVRRLHDTDRSGWWLLIGIIPIIGWIVLLYFFVISGTSGPNKYGPPRSADTWGYPR